MDEASSSPGASRLSAASRAREPSWLGDVSQAATGEIPDPLRPLFPREPDGDDRGRRWRNHQERRARILAAARSLLAEAGFASVYLRSIAARSELSVQSIYNIVGSREALLEAASAEWVMAIARDAADRAARLDQCRPFAIIEAYWRAPLVHRDYVQMTTQVSHSQRDPLTWPQLRAAVGALDAELRRLKAEGELRELVRTSSLAQQLVVLTHATIAGWVAEPYALSLFQDGLLSGPACMLLGALQGPERARLEHQLAVMPRW